MFNIWSKSRWDCHVKREMEKVSAYHILCQGKEHIDTRHIETTTKHHTAETTAVHKCFQLLLLYYSQFNKCKSKKFFLNRKGKKITYSTKPPHLETHSWPSERNKQLISFVQKGIKNISFTGKTGGRYLWEEESSQRKPLLMKLTVYTTDVALKSLPAPELKKNHKPNPHKQLEYIKNHFNWQIMTGRAWNYHIQFLVHELHTMNN